MIYSEPTFTVSDGPLASFAMLLVPANPSCVNHLSRQIHGKVGLGRFDRRIHSQLTLIAIPFTGSSNEFSRFFFTYPVYFWPV
jgi:hypothetical protein